ncbi:hypothetical protein B4168_1717 [Anoxybacillus flavithermus]|nr:hypothetical protein B4168_1717 [Anoxybacillus flavithermus]OAO84372.1 hypothetical protein GT23_3907 [Parageobacillus thermoglucosidasius]
MNIFSTSLSSLKQIKEKGENESGGFWFLKNNVRSISDYPIRQGKKGFL